MKNVMLSVVTLMGFLFSGTPFAHGDVPPPTPTPKMKEKKPETKLSEAVPTPTPALVIEAKATQKVARLQISRAVLTSLAVSNSDRKHGFLFGPEGDTLTAGIALALAIAFGGLWLARRVPNPRPPSNSRRTRLLVTATATVLLTGWLSASAFADRSVPKNLAQEKKKEGPAFSARVEVMERGREIKLVVSPEILRKALAASER